MAASSNRRLRKSRRSSALATSVHMQPLEGRQLFTAAISVTPVAAASAATTLGNALVVPNTGLNITNTAYNGANNQAGTYSGFNLTSGSETLVMPDGIILTSGLASYAAPPVAENSSDRGGSGDSNLNTLLGSPTYDANTLTFTFTTDASIKSINFDVLFGSNEFPQYVGSINDGFGAYLDGVQISFDSLSRPISISNNFFTYDNTGDTNYNKTASNFGVGYQGLTKALKTAAPLDSNLTTHTLKLVVADAGDATIDSGVFLANLRGSTQALSGPSTGDSSAPGSFEVSSATTSIANTASEVTITVNRTGGSYGAASIAYTTADGTALAGTHYTATSGVLNFADGETSKTITIPITSLPSAAAALDFTVTLSSPTGGASLGSGATQTVTLQNNRSEVSLASATYSANHADGTIAVTVNRTGNTTVGGSITIATTDGTALNGLDYTAVSATLTFDPGETTKTVNISLLSNPGAAASTNFTFSLGSAQSADVVIGASTNATITLTNSQTLIKLFSNPTISISENSATITLKRSGNINIPGAISYTTIDGTAIAGTDYTATTGTLTFNPAETTKTIIIPLLKNPIAPSSSNFSLNIQAADSTTVVDSVAPINISLSNTQSVLSIENPTYTATSGAADTNVNLTIIRTGNLNTTTRVGYRTISGTATAAEFTSTTGTLTFDPGESSKTISIPVLPSPAANAQTTFSVELTEAEGNTNDTAIAPGQSVATVTLTNPSSVIAFADTTYSVSEDDGALTVTLTRSGNLTEAAAITFTTADGTALAGINYVAASGTVTFEPGQTTASFQVQLLQDFSFTPKLAFSLNLSTPTGNAQLVDTTPATVTITNTTVLPPTVEPIKITAYDLIGKTNTTTPSNPNAPTSPKTAITNIALTFNQSLPIVPDVTQIILTATSKERPNGQFRQKQLVVGSVSYDTATNSLNIEPRKGLRRNRFYHVTISTIPGLSTDTITDETATQSTSRLSAHRATDDTTDNSSFSLWFARGRKVTYLDRDGNRVRLRVRGPGELQLIRSADGQGDILALRNTTENSKLKGRVLPSRFHKEPNGQTTLNTIIGLGDATNLLPDSIQPTDILN